MGASGFGRLPSDYKSGAIQIKPAKADFVCVAAISNRPVFLPKVDASDGNRAEQLIFGCISTL